MTSICHLSCCHFFTMGHLTFDTDSTSDTIAAIKSFFSDTMWAEAVIHLAMCHIAHLHAILYLGEGPLLTVSEVAPKRPGRY